MLHRYIPTGIDYAAKMPKDTPMPDPLPAEEIKKELGSFKTPPKPDFHACGYFDGAPWDICYACEYERNPAHFEREVRHSQLVRLICATFHCAKKGNKISSGYSNEVLEAVLAELNKPRAERLFTDAQIFDRNYRLPWGHTDYQLLLALRALCWA